MKYIPRKIKVKTEFFRNVTIGDVIYLVIIAGVTLALALANFAYSIWFALTWASIGITLFFPMEEGVRIYASMGYLFRFFALSKKFSKEKKKKTKPVSEMVPFEKIEQEKFISFGEYYGMVLQIEPIEFFLLNETNRELVCNAFANALRRLNENQTAQIVKINKAMVLDRYIFNESKKYDQLEELTYRNEMTDEEFNARAGMFEGRVSALENMNKNDKIFKDFFYIVVMDKDKEALETTVDGMIRTLASSPSAIFANIVYGKDLVVFLRGNYGKNFDERELENVLESDYGKWAMPDEIKFKSTNTIIDGQPYRNFVVTDYPIEVDNAWAYLLFMQDRTRVCIKFKPVPRHVAERQIDRAIIEMETKFLYSAKSSRQIENTTHLETLRGLLIGIKNRNQQLYNVNVFITCEEAARKEVRAILRQQGFKFTEMLGRQVDAFISSSISMRDNCEAFKRGIPTESLAACFPFISNAMQDDTGFYIGNNDYPVFVDFFKRNKERVNSNMMIIGKSGSGKSFATKLLLSNFTADASKIFILDPEDEYSFMVKQLKGKIIDVGTSQMGIINPFHVVTSLEDEEIIGADVAGSAKPKTDDSFLQHLQFLEQFFKTVLEEMNQDAFEVLQACIAEVYRLKNINETTVLTKLKAADYPIFDDLYKLISNKLTKETDEYHRRNLLIVQTYVQKFSSGGRSSNLWNGPTSISTNENFITFSFRSLLSNKNEVIANGQMLLIFRYLNKELIKNKEYNEKNIRASGKAEITRNMVIAVDEAHRFINPTFPMALNFMAEMAKQIRKYYGMLMVITQNIKDFVGSPEIQRQSTAVINACQYSMIFALAPNDMNDLVDLYSRSGEINESEQMSILTAGVGQCFLITGPMSRRMVQVVAQDYVRVLFDKKFADSKR